MSIGIASATVQRCIRVVVVDDCRDVRFLLGTILELDGRFEVVGEAHSAATGIDLVAEVEPDLVLVDLRLGRRDGAWLIHRLRSRDPEVAIAAVTGSVLECEHAAALEAGADSVHSKASLTSTMGSELLATVARRQTTVAA